MKAYKVTNNINGSCIISSANPFYREYSADDTVDMGLVFDTLAHAEAFDNYWSCGGDKIWEVGCAWLEPCERVGHWIWDVILLSFHDSRYEVLETSPPQGSLWGFEIRLIKEVL